MAALNTALLAIFPDSITFNGATIACIAPPLDLFKTINPNTYDAKVTFSFQILESDRTTAGMKLKDTIEFATPLAFQVANFQPDKDDSIVRLICNIKQ